MDECLTPVSSTSMVSAVTKPFHPCLSGRQFIVITPRTVFVCQLQWYVRHRSWARHSGQTARRATSCLVHGLQNEWRHSVGMNSSAATSSRQTGQSSTTTPGLPCGIPAACTRWGSSTIAGWAGTVWYWYAVATTDSQMRIMTSSSSSMVGSNGGMPLLSNGLASIFTFLLRNAAIRNRCKNY